MCVCVWLCVCVCVWLCVCADVRKRRRVIDWAREMSDKRLSLVSSFFPPTVRPLRHACASTNRPRASPAAVEGLRASRAQRESRERRPGHAVAGGSLFLRLTLFIAQ